MLINPKQLFQIMKHLTRPVIDYIDIYKNLYLKILKCQYLKIKHHHYILYYILICNQNLIKKHPNNPYYESTHRCTTIKTEY
jgi:hypothetical protein